VIPRTPIIAVLMTIDTEAVTRTMNKVKVYKLLRIETNSNNINRGGSRSRVLNLSTGAGSIRQKGQMVKTLGRGNGTIKMLRVNVHVESLRLVKELGMVASRTRSDGRRVETRMRTMGKE
jgi:hypothetical protein